MSKIADLHTGEIADLHNGGDIGYKAGVFIRGSSELL